MKVLAMVTTKGPERFKHMPLFSPNLGRIHARYQGDSRITFKLTRLGDGTPLKTYEDRGEQ